MTGLLHRSLDTPEETRPFEQGMGHVDLVAVDHGGVGRAIFEPGWQWSKHVKPIAQTDSCQASHLGYCVSGHMHIVMNDGEQADIGPGEYLEIAPGHDAWVVGAEPCVMIDWQGYADYAKAAAPPAGLGG